MKIFINELKFETLVATLNYFEDFCLANWNYGYEEALQNSVLNLRMLRDEFQSLLDRNDIDDNLRPLVEESIAEADSRLQYQDTETDLNQKISDNIDKWKKRFTYFHDLTCKLACYFKDCGLNAQVGMQIWLNPSNKSGDDQKRPEFVWAIEGIGIRMFFENNGLISLRGFRENDYIDGIYFPRLDLEDLNHDTLERVVRIIKQKYINTNHTVL